jgi:hypothetical protein
VRLSRRSTWAAGDTRAFLVLLALAVGLWLPRLRGPLDLRYDAGVYYTLGTAIAEGRGYRLLNEPGAIQAIQYPPLLPMLGAIHEWALGTDDPAVVGPWLRRTFFALFLGYVAAVYLLSRRYLHPGYAFLVGLVTTLHVQTIFFSDLFGAEIPYALATVLFFLCLPEPVKESEGEHRATWRPFAAGALAVAAYGLRTAGAALLAAWVGESLLRRRWKQLASRTMVAAAVIGTWQGYAAHVKGSPEYQHPAYAYQRAGYQFYNVGYLDNIAYIDPFRPELGHVSAGDLVHRVLTNQRYFPKSLGEAVSMPSGWWDGEIDRVNEKLGVNLPHWIGEVALIGLSLPVVAGLILLAGEGAWLLTLYLLTSIALISLTPWPGQFSRYLNPLTPFLVLALLTVPAALATRQSRGSRPMPYRAAEIALTAAVVLVVLQQTYTVAKAYTKHHQPATYTDAHGQRHDYALFFYDETWRLQDSGLAWLAARAKPGQVVATSTPHWAYLKTGLRAVMPPFEPDPGRAQELVDGVPVQYLVVDALSFLDIGRRYTRPMLEHFPERWRLIYGTVDSGPRIYQRLLPGEKNVSPSMGVK